MKILVVDDNTIHQKAAKAQLKDHDTTVVGSYGEGQKLVRQKHEFEVVLVDLLMPAWGQGKLEGQEMPVGIFLALLAAKNGAKYVAVFTDSNHHQHPASTCFDAFNPEGEGKPDRFIVEGAKIILSNSRNWIKPFRKDNLAQEVNDSEYFCDLDSGGHKCVEAKDWLTLLKYLVSDESAEEVEINH